MTLLTVKGFYAIFCLRNFFCCFLFTAYSPLGSRNRPGTKPDDPVLLKDPKIAEIGKKYRKSTPQICIKWQIERGVTVIPKFLSIKNTRKCKSKNFQILEF